MVAIQKIRQERKRCCLPSIFSSFASWNRLIRITALITFVSLAILYYNYWNGMVATLQSPLQNKQPQQRKNYSFRRGNNNDTSSVLKSSNRGTDEQHIQPQLRFDWKFLPVQSSVAQYIDHHQSNCSLPASQFKFKTSDGLGAELHTWQKGLCAGMEEKHRIVSNIKWDWYDQEHCATAIKSTTTTTTKAFENSALQCYFPLAENRCLDNHNSRDMPKTQKEGLGQTTGMIALHQLGHLCGKYTLPTITTSYRNRKNVGPHVGYTEFRTGATEYLFQSVSPLVIHEAQRQLQLVFPPHGKVPPNLITVHMRWGDKIGVGKEMMGVNASMYVQAVQQILNDRTTTKAGNEHDDAVAHVYLATEDPKAVQAFTTEAPSPWKIYVDQFFHDMLQYRATNEQNQSIDVYNQAIASSRKTKGHAGLVAIASLLLAMESNDFVLTTASNWSRLMNELRKGILNPRCNNCTTLIDLQPANKLQSS